MLDMQLIMAVTCGIGVLLLLILTVRLQAFLALLIASITVGLVAGLPPIAIMNAIQQGMGSTLGFVAVVIGLGAIFGAILEHSGGAQALANYLLSKFGEKRASWAMVVTGFFVSIPVFFDGGFIILIPILYALQRKNNQSLLLYAIPLLAGLAVTHTFIPPTPGPVAVADILQADLGWVILFGAFAGIPAAIVAGPLFGRYIAGKIMAVAPALDDDKMQTPAPPPIAALFAIIGLPILLILVNTFIGSPFFAGTSFPSWLTNTLALIGHPFGAMLIANLVAWYFLGIRKGFTRQQLLDISSKSLAPAGLIILLTGAGGVFKQMLVDTGTGKMLAEYFAQGNLNILWFGFLAAAVIRILQGSATVAMITAAGITAPLLDPQLHEWSKAMVVIGIAAGASILSHVNDSGFWLVSKYLGLTEKQTFKSWTVMTTLLAITAFSMLLLLSLVV